ncbi:hypothetical protein, partial [Campylobacter rectus]
KTLLYLLIYQILLAFYKALPACALAFAPLVKHFCDNALILLYPLNLKLGKISAILKFDKAAKWRKNL